MRALPYGMLPAIIGSLRGGGDRRLPTAFDWTGAVSPRQSVLRPRVEQVHEQFGRET